MMSHLLLVNAPYPRSLTFAGQPTSLLYASALAVPWLEGRFGRGSVRLVNYDLVSPDDFLRHGSEHFKQLVADTAPAMIAVSTSTAALENARRLAAAAKEVADPPLVVDPNAMLALPLSLESFESVSWWHAQIL